MDLKIKDKLALVTGSTASVFRGDIKINYTFGLPGLIQCNESQGRDRCVICEAPILKLRVPDVTQRESRFGTAMRQNPIGQLLNLGMSGPRDNFCLCLDRDGKAKSDKDQDQGCHATPCDLQKKHLSMGDWLWTLVLITAIDVTINRVKFRVSSMRFSLTAPIIREFSRRMSRRC